MGDLKQVAKLFSIVASEILSMRSNNTSVIQNGRPEKGEGAFETVTTFVKPDVFIPCLIDLCKSLWELMKSYHQTLEWHRQNDIAEASNSDVSTTEPGSKMKTEANLNQSYIQQKLESGLSRIWIDVQQKVKIYLLSTDLSSFKYDQFIQVLDIVNRLIQVGEEFCGGKSETLEESIRKQSLNYFRSYHRTRLDELKMFLENEGWELCPVKSSFTIFMLQEFKFIRQSCSSFAITNGSSVKRGADSSSLLNESTDSSAVETVSFFTKYATNGSPFDFQTEEDEGEDVLELNGAGRVTGVSRDSDSDDDIPDELKAEFVDERTGEVPSQPKSNALVRRRSYRSSGKLAPIVTNTTLTVCRLLGKYMQMMLVLKPIAFDVIICMTQLFDYYLYAVYSFFAPEAETLVTGDTIMSSKLRATLKRIRENLIHVDESAVPLSPQSDIPSPDGSQSINAAASDERRDHVAHPHISPTVDLERSDTLYGLAERVVATESLMFLTEQFKLLQQRLEDAIPSAKKAFLQQYFSQTLSTTSELRRPVYRSVAVRSVNVDSCLAMMMTVKWDVKDIMSQHSTYVDALLKELHSFDENLSTVSKRVPIPKAVHDSLWEHVIRLVCSTFVEGFAGAKKCTNEGRALMQLDFQQFLNKLEKLTDLRPIPGRELVEVYIKAYYLPEAQLETWIYDHKEYSCRQLLALVNCLGHISKKSRQRLITIIEDVDRLNKR